MIEMLITILMTGVFAIGLSYDFETAAFDIRTTLNMVFLVLGATVMLGALPLGMMLIPAAGYVYLFISSGGTR